MIPIIKWTMWQRRISTFWWSLAVAFFVFLNMAFYPSFKDQAEEFEKSFENLPDAAIELFGGSTDFFSPVGFLNSQIFFLMMPILLGILAIGLGASLLAREEQDGTIEPLLARPISRTKFLAAKGLAGAGILSAVTLVSLVTTLVMVKLVDLDIAAQNVFNVTLVCFLMALSFGAVAFWLSALGRARGGSIGIATAFAFGGYIISSLAGTVTWLEGPGKIFPFHYYQSEAILRGTYDWLNVLVFVGIVVGAWLISWQIFKRRDIA